MKPDVELEGRQYYLVETVAEHLGISQRVVQQWCQQGHLPARRFEGYRWLIPHRALYDNQGHWKWLPPKWSALSDHPINQRIAGLIAHGLERRQNTD